MTQSVTDIFVREYVGILEAVGREPVFGMVQ